MLNDALDGFRMYEKRSFDALRLKTYNKHVCVIMLNVHVLTKMY